MIEQLELRQLMTATAPVITAATSANVAHTTATLGGDVTSNGGATLTGVGVVYSLTSVNPNPQIGGAGVINLTSSPVTGVFTVNASGLTPGDSYSFRAYATNSSGTSYTSPVSTFTTSINHAPVGTSGTVTGGLNTPYVLKAANFGFTDPNDTPADSLLAVKFTLLPTAGTLQDNGVNVTANQLVSVSDINAGKLIFIPNSNLPAGTYFAGKFEVEDNGGTVNGGANLDATAKVLDINLVHINHAPIGTSGTVSGVLNQPYTFTAANFGFSDPNDSPPNTMAGVRFTLLPTAGTLKDNGVAVTVNQVISISDINAGRLTFTPNSGLPVGTYFAGKFEVEDNGGTAAGGVNFDTTARVMDIHLTTTVNHAPIGRSNTVNGSLHTTYTFAAGDFGFSDPNDSPPNAMAGVRFTLLPTAGTLKDNGVAVAVNQVISIADINAGLLTFHPNGNLPIGTYFAGKFEVEDNGGTANGGVNFDTTARVMDIRLT